MLNHLTLSEIENISALAEQAAQRTARQSRRTAYAALRAALAALGHEARMELKALMWVGHDDSFASFFRGSGACAPALRSGGRPLHCCEGTRAPGLSPGWTEGDRLRPGELAGGFGVMIRGFTVRR